MRREDVFTCTNYTILPERGCCNSYTVTIWYSLFRHGIKLSRKVGLKTVSITFMTKKCREGCRKKRISPVIGVLDDPWWRDMLYEMGRLYSAKMKNETQLAWGDTTFLLCFVIVSEWGEESLSALAVLLLEDMVGRLTDCCFSSSFALLNVAMWMTSTTKQKTML